MDEKGKNVTSFESNTLCLLPAIQIVYRHCWFCVHRYIEIFRSSLSEVNSVVGFGGGGGNRRMGGGPGGGMFNPRPSPYDRGDRYGGGGGGRFQSRGSRNFKGSNFSHMSGKFYISFNIPCSKG